MIEGHFNEVIGYLTLRARTDKTVARLAEIARQHALQINALSELRAAIMMALGRAAGSVSKLGPGELVSHAQERRNAVMFAAALAERVPANMPADQAVNFAVEAFQKDQDAALQAAQKGVIV